MLIFLQKLLCKNNQNSSWLMQVYTHTSSLGRWLFEGENSHCKENPIYVLLSWELRGLIPNFHIDVSVSYLYIPRIDPHTVFPHTVFPCSRIGRPIQEIYKISHRYLSVGSGRKARKDRPHEQYTYVIDASWMPIVSWGRSPL